METKKNKRIRRIGQIAFVLYMLFLFYFLLFSDWYGRTGELQEYRYNLELFKEIRRFWVHRRQIGVIAAANLLGNILIFVPFGFLLPIATECGKCSRVTLYGFGVTFAVEMIQLVTKVGSFDVDDLFLNTVGVIIGYLLWKGYKTVRRMRRVE